MLFALIYFSNDYFSLISHLPTELAYFAAILKNSCVNCSLSCSNCIFCDSIKSDRSRNVILRSEAESWMRMMMLR
jgi:hypothetical protein